MSAHTPGPWFVHRELDGEKIKFVHVYSSENKFYGPIAKITNNNQIENARLIALAPEMLELLKYFCRKPKDVEDLPGMEETPEEFLASAQKYYDTVKEGQILIKKIEGEK